MNAADEVANATAPLTDSSAGRKRRPRRVPFVVMATLAVTAFFSALVFGGSELVFTQTITLQKKLSLLTEARVNGLRMQQDLHKAEAASWAYLGTGKPDHLRDFQQASREALLHFGLMQGILNSEPILRERSRPLAGVLQQHLDGMGEMMQAARQGRVSEAMSQAQADALHTRPQRTMAELMRLDQALLDTEQQVHTDAARTLSRQRTGAVVLLGLNLLFLSALAARTIQHFYEHEKQRRSLSDQTLKLEAAVEERTNALHELSTYLQRQSEREKSSLARELHDELGALLTAAKLDVAWLEGRNPDDDPQSKERLSRLSRAMDQALNIKRRVLESLRPSMLDHLGLGPALIWYVQQTCDSAGLLHEIDVPEDGVQMDRDTALALYRIVQEALNNTIQHAGAREVHVTLKSTPSSCKLRIQDDGIGIVDFHPDRLSHGVAGMRHRAMAIGAQFTIRSAPGQGTCIEVRVPRSAMLQGGGVSGRADGSLGASLNENGLEEEATATPSHAGSVASRQAKPWVTAYVANSALLDTPILVKRRLR